MSLLPDNYWDEIEQPVTPSPSPAPVVEETPVVSQPVAEPGTVPAGEYQPTTTLGGAMQTLVSDEPTKITIKGDLTEEQQIKKFGGVVGSPEYYATISKGSVPADPTKPLSAENVMQSMQAPHNAGLELASAFGFKLPQGEEWDKMSTADKIASVQVESTKLATKTVLALPKTVVGIVGSVLATAAKPFYNMFTGKPSDAQSLQKEKPWSLPWVGEIPTLYETRQKALDSGMGPGMSSIFAGSDFVLKTTAMLPITEALVNTFKPRPYTRTNAGLIENGTKNTEPIKFAPDANGTYTAAPKGSVSEYYTMPKTEATNFGGNTNNIKWKMVPASEGEQSLSVVKNVKAKVGTYVKTDYGLKKVVQGDFGPEISLYTAPIKMGPLAETKIVSPGEKSPVFILPEARKGMELRPITQDQIGTLNQIGEMKQMDPTVRDAVIKTLTGKENLGELTEAEYVRVSQTLSKFGEKYGVQDTKLGPLALTRSIISPPRHYFSYLEDTFGYPVNSQIYQPLERAQQLVKVLDDSIQPELDGIFGKYSSQAMVEERRLIDAYVRGDQGAITTNTTLTPQMKTEMIDIANKLTAWDNQYGEILGVGKDAYLANYGGPKIANLGGVFPQYKDLTVNPQKEFFAKFKREGSLDPFIDDPYASRQIYIKEGAKALHYGPVLENFEAMKGSLPPEIYRQANSYVQEKMGKLGPLEKFLDSFVPKINKKLGVNLPADATRQGISYGLSSMYSGIVGTPQAMFKQLFQLPTFVYSRLGTRFAGEALKKSMDPKERARIAKLGYLNEISQPYGAELAKDFNPVNKAGKIFKEYTQATVKPMTFVDNDIRIKTFLQGEAQWNDALNLYKDGKIQWNQLETKLDFNAFSQSNRNIIRQKLADGDEAGAFDVYIRDIIDETSFPYRTGSGARIGYGMSGKLATGLLNYTIESSNVLLKWMGTGQWEKIIRFAGNAKIVNDTLEEEFGMDFGNTLYQIPTGIISPVMGFVGSVYDYFKAVIDRQREEMNKNSAEIIRTLSSSAPSGLVAKNLNNFRKSIAAGVDENGQYAIYDQYGKVIRNGDFTDLFWGTLMGFPTVEKIKERSLYTDIRNSQTKEQEIKSEIDQLMREGKYDEMEKLVEKTGITPSASAMQSGYIPRTQRQFETLSPQLKADFIPRVYPN